MTILMFRREYVCDGQGDEVCLLEHFIQHLGFVLTVGIYVASGGLFSAFLRSAPFLSHLVWRAADPILGFDLRAADERLGRTNPAQFSRPEFYACVEHTWEVPIQSDGHAWTGIVFGLGAGNFHGLPGPRLSGGAASARRQGFAFRETRSHHRVVFLRWPSH